MSRLAALFFAMLVLAMLVCTMLTLGLNPAWAQQEFPPPQGKGRVVIVVSGQAGTGHLQGVAEQIAKLGYDAVLYDGNPLVGTYGAGIRDAVRQSLQMPHAIPGKVGLVGFSLGGGEALVWGSRMADIAAVVVAWYPVTSNIHHPAVFGNRIRVPVLVFAGESDTYRNCCLISSARALAAAAAGRPFELVTYPGVEHDFVWGGSHYDAAAYADSMQRVAVKLEQYLR